jgi:signal transduction histidine kinase/ligand-binding sensor domain-containing protein
MKTMYIFLLLLISIAGTATGQAKYKWFSSISLSQNSNYYIYHSSRNQVFISSRDGLNIYDGQQVKSYRPLTHNMYGSFVTSTFFEDTSGHVWFSTYEALHCYNPITDSLDYVFMTSSQGIKDTANYTAFHLSGNILYLKAEGEIFLFDVVSRSITAVYPVDILQYYFFAILNDNNRTVLFGANQDGYLAYALEENNRGRLLYQGEGTVTSLCVTQAKQIWIGLVNGNLVRVDDQSGNVMARYPLADTEILGIRELSGDRLLMTIAPNELVDFDVSTQKVVDRYIPQRAGTKECVDYVLLPYVDRDSTLWVGGASQGVFFCDLKKQKFRHYLNTGPDQKQINVTRIIPIDGNQYAVFSRRNGIFLINDQGDIIHHWLQLPDGVANFTATCAAPVNEREIVFSSSRNKLYILGLHSKRIRSLQPDPSGAHLGFHQIEKLDNGKLIASCREDLLVEIQIEAGRYVCKPYGGLEAFAKGTYNFKTDQAGNLYVSNDETSVLVLHPTPEGGHRFAWELPITGGINSLMEVRDKPGFYFTNSYGLFYLNTDNCETSRIRDKDDLLAQTIYAVLEDTLGDFWLSSNKGILRYTPESGKVKAYALLDGVQAEEFNSHAYLKTKDGHIFFGGINGLNFFHPATVATSSKAAPIYIRAVKINDEVDTSYVVPEFQDSYILPYTQNTISFDFHAVDYADPRSTRVKYKLEGVDPDYIESQDERGFARYANLRHGHYTLMMLGANADGHWNEKPRAIAITILPPFWLTWWFMTLMGMIGIGIVYGAIRLYYQRKLEQSKQLLREQALIIEKQTALEHERNRIASEMHDDLGSGLTTIRYLSDKALRQAKDTQEASQIKRISEHSNTLVRNMSEIIWAMNSRFDTAENLVGYLRRYASEYLEEHQVPLKFISGAGDLHAISMGGEKRRNVFLVFKEMLHNAVKYAGAERMEIEVNANDELHIHIAEIGGKGFDPAVATENGNGLFNSRKRMDTAGGSLTFEKTNEAMTIHISVPLKAATGE